MKKIHTFLAVALLILGIIISQAQARPGKGKMGGGDRAMKSGKMDRSLGRGPDAARINKRFTKDLEDLKRNFDKGSIDKSDFDKKAADLKAKFLKDLKDAAGNDQE